LSELSKNEIELQHLPLASSTDPSSTSSRRLKMVGPDGLEPSTPRLSSACSNQLSYEPKIGESGDDLERCSQFGGADEIRTRDPLLAKQMLYQLSYDPKIGRFAVKNTRF
jgi:hypothetical protein